MCAKCATLKFIAFIEARQTDVICKILDHCGFWNPPALRPPPRPPARAPAAPAQRTAEGIEIDPDFLEHLHREQQADQLQLPWDP